MHRLKSASLAYIAFLSLASVSALPATKDMEPKPASAATVAAQARMRASLPTDNGQDDEFVNRGFIATLKDPVIKRSEERRVGKECRSLC